MSERYPVDSPLYEYLDGWKEEKCLDQGYKPLEEIDLGFDESEEKYYRQMDKDRDEDDGGYE